MSKSEELKAGLASVGIGWVEPNDLRNKVGLFMLNHGVKMGVPVDPADVQTMMVEFTEARFGDLTAQVKVWRDLAERALAVKPNPPIIIPASLPRTSCNRHNDCRAADEKAKANGAPFGAWHCHDECCEDCFGC